MKISPRSGKIGAVWRRKLGERKSPGDWALSYGNFLLCGPYFAEGFFLNFVGSPLQLVRLHSQYAPPSSQTSVYLALG